MYAIRSYYESRENITDVVHQVVKLLDPIAAKSGVILEEEKQDGADLFVRMDASQMQQVFINLIVNGIHATPQQGKVHRITSYNVCYTKLLRGCCMGVRSTPRFTKNRS